MKHQHTVTMKQTLFVLSVALLSLSIAQGLNPNQCDLPNLGSTLQVFHVNSPCSPLRPPKVMSWEDTVLQLQEKDQGRLQFLSSSLVAKKSVVPIAPGRQILQSATYVVKVQIGTPAQSMLMAVDTSNDAAWVPCSGCVGCSSSVVLDYAKSTSFKSLDCQASQCKQVAYIHLIIYALVLCLEIVYEIVYELNRHVRIVQLARFI